LVLEASSNKSVIKILEGETALGFLEEETFRNQWKVLLQECGCPSVFQDSAFVLPWYKEHLHEFSPLIIVAFSENRLVGLLTLARKSPSPNGKTCNKLFGAGSFYSLYQFWNVLPEFLEVFWDQGIKSLLEKIPGCIINLKSLPNIDLFHSMEHFPQFRNMTVLEKLHNPVLDFDLEGYEKVFGKRHFKSKINRLNRAGNIEFRKITEADELKNLFPQIVAYYNIRQGAAFNKIAFPAGINNWRVFLQWLKADILHVTALWLDGVMIGAIIMFTDFGKTAHLAGLITYSPTHAKFSPGLVHLYLVSQMLKENSFKQLKLSPGYDAYKDRFANRREEIYEILITASKFQILKRKLRIVARKGLLKMGTRPMEFDVWLSKRKSKMVNRLWKLSQRISNKQPSYDAVIARIKYLTNTSDEYQIINGGPHLDSLLLATDRTFLVSRWEFLEDSLKRLEENESFISFLYKGNLEVNIWYTGKAIDLNKASESNLDQSITKIYTTPNFFK
jgi:hypothetical protein